MNPGATLMSTVLRHLAGGYLVLASLGIAPGCKSPETRVIGYMPAWKDLRSTVDRTDLSKLTHINIAFLNPDTAGALISATEPVCMSGAASTDIRYLIEKAHRARVRVLVSLAGGVIPGCAGDWRQLLQPTSRQQLVDDLLRFAADYELDGIDVDLEGALLTAIHEDGNYTPFIEALAAGLEPAGKLLTCATASYEGGMIPVETIAFFDFVNIMSYDAIGPSWGTAGSEHATYEQAVAHIDTWRGRGLTPDKLVLGVPFYGYGFGGDYRSSYGYGDILEAFGDSAAAGDLLGTACDGCSYLTYNGPSTIRRKTRLALQAGSGVMIWEMSHDASAPSDLLSVVHAKIAASR